MKSKNRVLLVLGIFSFILMFLFLQLNLVGFIDVYSLNIQKLFSNISFKHIFLIITNIMSVFGILIILLLTSYWLRKQEAKKDILIYIISIGSCFVITNFFKILIKRERPLELLLDVGGYSFPSSHSSISMVVYGYLILLIRKYYYGKHKSLLITLCVLCILLTGLSRIYFNVHYITDVIAGFGLGLIVLCISNHFLKKIK